MDLNELVKKYDKNNEKRLLFLLRKNSEKWLSYNDIKKMIPNESPNTCKLLTLLKKDNLVDIQIFRTSGKYDTRKFRLNEEGCRLADELINKGLRDKEIKILRFLNLLQDCSNKQIYKDFWDIISLLQQYDINDNAQEIFVVFQNFLKSIKNLYQYEVFHTQSLSLETSPIQNIDKGKDSSSDKFTDN